MVASNQPLMDRCVQLSVTWQAASTLSEKEARLEPKAVCRGGIAGRGAESTG